MIIQQKKKNDDMITCCCLSLAPATRHDLDFHPIPQPTYELFQYEITLWLDQS